VVALFAALLLAGPVAGDDNDIVVGTSAVNTASAATSVQISGLTISSAPNRLLVVGVSISNDRWQVSGITRGIGEVFARSGEGRGPAVTLPDVTPTAEVWYNVAPSTGNTTITVTLAVRVVGDTPPDPDIVAFAVELSNVNQLNPQVAQSGTQGTDANPNGAVILLGSATGQGLRRRVAVAVIAPLGNIGSTTSDGSGLEVELRQANTGAGTANVLGAMAVAPTFPSGPILKPNKDQTASASWTGTTSTRWGSEIALFTPVNDATLARFHEATAERIDDVVLLRWRTNYEVSNLGFRLWRQDGAERTLLNESPVAGSALFVGADTELSAGRSYRWLDGEAKGREGASYWIEALDLSGESTWHGPIYPEMSPVAREGKPGVRSALLEDLGSAPSGVVLREPGIPAQTGQPADLESLELSSGSAETPSSFSTAGKARTPFETQRAIAAQPGAKISVDREGWYRVTRASLVAAGYDPGADLKDLRLFTGGVEQPILVREGDAVEFYGVPQDTAWTGSRVYWLTAAGRGGLKIAAAKAGRRGSPAGPSFPFAVERRDRTVYFAALTNNGDESSFFGGVVSGKPLDQELAVNELGQATEPDYPLEVSIQGATTNITHTIRVAFNGNDTGTMSFRDQQRGRATFRIPADWIKAGNNVVTLSPQGGSTDVSTVDWIRLTYPHAYAAEQGALKLTAQSGSALSVKGFSSRAVRVLDVTSLRSIQELPVSVSGSDSGAFSVSVNIPGNGLDTRSLFAFSDDRILTPTAIVANRPSAWHEEGKSGRHWIIAPRSLVASVAPLAAHRTAQGLASQVIDVEDLYDEFSFGEKTPYAIRDFIRTVAGDAQGRYAVLVGDATYDPRNYEGGGAGDLVPTKLVPTAKLKTASDSWFGVTSTGDIPSVPVGRISVRTSEDAARAVARIIEWESAASAGAPWRQKVLHLADTADAPEVNPVAFESVIDGLSAFVPAPLQVSNVATGSMSVGQARSRVTEEMNAGQLLVTWIGHGSQANWSKRSIFTNTEAAALVNGTKLPIVISLSCLGGFFIDGSVDSLAEILQKNPNGGAIASWASSSLTEPFGQEQLGAAAYSALFSAGPTRLGDAFLSGLAAANDPDVRKTWVLFGDPALKLR
jgi:hypothetical protein